MSGHLEDLRDRLLEAALAHVVFDGWTDAALRRAARDAGLKPDAVRFAFPGGGRDLLDWFARRGDAQLAAALAQDRGPRANGERLRVRDAIARAVRLRLEAMSAHREAVRRGLALLALPHNLPRAATQIYHTVDTIWAGLGDRSADFNFYSKRALLAGVYLTTLLYWLGDESDDFVDSWDFLDRRIADVMTIQKLRGQTDKATAGFPSALRLLSFLRYPGRPRFHI